MSFKRGERVSHPKRPNWGLGQVLADSAGGKVSVFFVGTGEKTISFKHVMLDRVPMDQAAHPVLDNLRLPGRSARIRYQSLPESIERFLKRFPGGFYGDRFAEEERDYKVRAHQLAQDLLSQSELDRLLSANDSEEVCRRSLRVSNATKLIFPNEKIALRDGLKLSSNGQDFSTALFDLLYGKDDLKPRFERYADVLERIGAAKWTLATYFLFVVFPEEHMFLKPIATQNAAAISGFEISYRPGLNWHTYAAVLKFSGYLKAELVELSPRDMIDVQSFMWCIKPRKL